MISFKLWIFRIYAEIISRWEDYKHRNDPPLPPVPCQICGKPGHKESYYPNAKEFGFFDE